MARKVAPMLDGYRSFSFIHAFRLSQQPPVIYINTVPKFISAISLFCDIVRFGVNKLFLTFLYTEYQIIRVRHFLALISFIGV